MPSQKRKTPSRVLPADPGRLERKVDGFYSLLTSTNPLKDEAANLSSDHVSPTAHSLSQPCQYLRYERRDTNIPNPNTSSQVSEISGVQTQTLTSPNSNSAAPTLPASSGSLMDSTFDTPPQEAQKLLNFFREDMLCLLPFMVISPSKPACKIQSEYPFLWLCIMAITSKSSSQQAALNRAVRSNLGRLMLVEGERSLDLLYGTMTCIVW